MNAKEIVSYLIEEGPDEFDPKDQLLSIPDWKSEVVKRERFSFLTDRWGDTRDVAEYEKLPEAVRLRVDYLIGCMGQNENSFVAIDSEGEGLGLGVLFEEEYELCTSTTQENEDRFIKELLYFAHLVQREFPQAAVSVNNGAHIFEDRFAIRAFLPENQCNPNTGAQLGEAISPSEFNRRIYSDKI